MSRSGRLRIGHLSGLGLNVGDAPGDRRTNGKGLTPAGLGAASVELGQLALQGLKPAGRLRRQLIER